MIETYELTLRGEFSAAHQIRLHDGSLEPMHGHNWRVEVELSAKSLDSIGIVADFVMLERRLKDVLARYHNCSLNAHADYAKLNPTTEHVAKAIATHFGEGLPKEVKLDRVRVWETSNCAAAFVPVGDEPY